MSITVNQVGTTTTSEWYICSHHAPLTHQHSPHLAALAYVHKLVTIKTTMSFDQVGPCEKVQNKHSREPRSEAQIRRFFGGRHPLCGNGVHSWTLVMIRPLACSVLMDDCLPWPRPLTRSWTYVIPAARFSSHVEVFYGKAHCLSMKVLPLPRQGGPHTHSQHPKLHLADVQPPRVSRQLLRGRLCCIAGAFARVFEAQRTR